MENAGSNPASVQAGIQSSPLLKRSFNFNPASEKCRLRSAGKGKHCEAKRSSSVGGGACDNGSLFGNHGYRYLPANLGVSSGVHAGMCARWGYSTEGLRNNHPACRDFLLK